jgi:DnaJ-class molecular chaperone
MNKKVTLCNTCNGAGYNEVQGRGPDGNGDPREWGITYRKVPCGICKGSGRMVQTITTRPFVEGED